MSTGGHQVLRSLLHWRLGTGQRQARSCLPSSGIAPWWGRDGPCPQASPALQLPAPRGLSGLGCLSPLCIPGKTLWKPSDAPVGARGSVSLSRFLGKDAGWDGSEVSRELWSRRGVQQEARQEPLRSPSCLKGFSLLREGLVFSRRDPST